MPFKKSTIESMQCPVCAQVLGLRHGDDFFQEFCTECKVTFFWNMGEKKPYPIFEPKKSNKCDCGGCRYRNTKIF